MKSKKTTVKGKAKTAAKPIAPKINIYKLEKGIPLSEPFVGKSGGGPGRVSLTLSAMEKGDSFLIRDELEALKASKTLRDRNGRGDGKNFTQRKVKNGWRVWRVE